MIGAAKQALRQHNRIVPLMRRLLVLVRNEGMAGITLRVRNRLVMNVPNSGQNATPAADGAAKKHGRNLSLASHAPQAPLMDLSPGALLVGHPYAVLGRGEDIRTAANAFEIAQLPFSIRNAWGDVGRETAAMHKEFRLMDRIGTDRPHKANVFFLNADEMDNAVALLGATFFQGRYNIGYWAWELSRFPDAWLGALSNLDEIWAPSRFIQQAVAEKTDCPVVWMPLAVELADSIRVSREYFGLPDASFLFLFFFDFRSFVGRKNPMAVLRAFARAFSERHHSRDVRLVIKIHGTHSRPDDYQTFRALEEFHDSRIILIDKVLDDQEIKELVRLCDCFVSLHRSEGFGRGLAEAMFLGKPVIATGYSGNLDFTNEMNACLVDHLLVPVGENEYPHAAGQLWADPDVEQAAWFMRRLVSETGYAAEKGRCAELYIKTYHSYAAVGARYRRRLDQLKTLS